MKRSIALRFFNEKFSKKANAIPYPKPWRSAQIELSDVPKDYPWKQLQLFINTQPQPLFLKKQQQHGWCLHADWPASEPGYHQIELYAIADRAAHAICLWKTHFFIAAAPLSSKMWIQILDETYGPDTAYLKPESNVPFVHVQSKHPMPLNNRPLATEFHRWIQSLQTQELQQSLEKIKAVQTQIKNSYQPLYRTRKLPTMLLQRDLNSISANTRVYTSQPAPFLAGAAEIHFLMQCLKKRMQHIQYYLLQKQAHVKNSQLPYFQQQLQQQWLSLQQQWRTHPFKQTPAKWDSYSLKRLEQLAQTHSAYKPWWLCAKHLHADYKPGLKTNHNADFYSSYMGFAYVYQRWCGQKLSQQIDTELKTQPHHHWKAIALGIWKHKNGGYLYLAQEQRYKPQSKALNNQQSYSISRGQHPDFSLLYFKNLKNLTQEIATCGLVFEVKFRHDKQRPRKADLDRLHAYRDAVYSALTHQPLFVGGGLLYPGETVHYTQGFAALSCLPERPLRLNCLLKRLLSKVASC